MHRSLSQELQICATSSSVLILGEADIRRQAIDELVRSRSTLLHSSRSLGWPFLLMEEHLIGKGDFPMGFLSGPVLAFWQTAEPLRCDHPDVKGRFVPQLVAPRALSLFVRGPIASVRTSIPLKVVLCGLDPNFFGEMVKPVEEEGNLRTTADGDLTQDKACFLDQPVEAILMRLYREMVSGGPLGPSYVNDCCHALLARMLHVIQAGRTSLWQRDTLHVGFVLQLMKQLEETQKVDLSLNFLAKKAGYSERQLLRVFKANTGRSPHRYVLDLKLEKARRLMLNRSLRLIDIAAECGFSSHPHFSQSFLERFGCVPSLYRASL